jgi:3-deoxy-D-manno-octulosonic-acid transferase
VSSAPAPADHHARHGPARQRSALGFAWAAAAAAAAPALALYLRRRVRLGKEIPERLNERRGIDASLRPPGRLIWVHAASLGETMSVLPVIAAIRSQAPEVTLLVTTGTVTSARLVEQRLRSGDPDGRVIHRFVPLDVPTWAGRFLDHWRPDAGAFVESELWPNLLAACRARGIKLALLNGRLSARSAANWARAPRFAREVLGSFSRIRARSDADAARFRDLGAPHVEAAGDLKFAAPPLPACETELARLRGILGARPVWLAASTHPGEETVVLEAHGLLAAYRPTLVTIVVPRHPERGEAIAAEAARFAVTRRAAGQPPPSGGIWVADTMGELGLFYRLAGLAFIGRSLVPPGGGQNPLEAAQLGCAIATGPYTGNFTEHMALLRAADAAAAVHDSGTLAAWVQDLIGDPAQRSAMAARAKAAVARHDDLPEQTACVLLDLAGVT